MRPDRTYYRAFMRGCSFAELDDEGGLVLGTSEKMLRKYLKMLTEKPRTHFRHRGTDQSRRRWRCGHNHVTSDYDRVTCRRCLRYVDRIDRRG